MSDKCKWEIEDSYGEDQEFYITECGESQLFSEGSASGSEYKYCPYCSKEIEVV